MFLLKGNIVQMNHGGQKWTLMWGTVGQRVCAVLQPTFRGQSLKSDPANSHLTSADSACARVDSPPGETSYATYHFQPSMNHHQTLVTSAHFWFYTERGVTANSSAPLFILTPAKQLLQAAAEPSVIDSEGWSIYQLDQNLLASVAEGPFMLQVRCPARQCHADEPDKMPFLHLHAQPRGPARTPRQAPVIVPWSSSAGDLLQRPSPERPLSSDCHRAEVEISFQELGWDSWIIHPKVLSFSYCHGNCPSWDGTTTRLEITQCCAPAPSTMKSLKVTTSDGGYSFKCETLPNIIPEECTCI